MQTIWLSERQNKSLISVILFLLTVKEGNIVTAILTDVKTSQPALTEGGKDRRHFSFKSSNTHLE